MYDLFRWTSSSAQRNRLTMEYEPLQPFFLFALAQMAKCKTFLDVGANIGAYSLFASHHSNIGRIVAFEPDPQTLNELRSNVALNGLERRIEVQGKAVSNDQGSVTLGVVGKLSGANSVIDTSIHDRSAFQRQVTVETVSLDQLFASPLADAVCIKVDVEGHECKVLEGAEAMLKANRAVIQIEGYVGGAPSGRKLEELGYRRLTNIGPDHYYSNIYNLWDPALIVEMYESASSSMIEFYHRNKPVSIGAGDFTIQLAGKSAVAVRSLKARLGKGH